MVCEQLAAKCNTESWRTQDGQSTIGCRVCESILYMDVQNQSRGSDTIIAIVFYAGFLLMYCAERLK